MYNLGEALLKFIENKYKFGSRAQPEGAVLKPLLKTALYWLYLTTYCYYTVMILVRVK